MVELANRYGEDVGGGEGTYTLLMTHTRHIQLLVSAHSGSLIKCLQHPVVDGIISICFDAFLLC